MENTATTSDQLITTTGLLDRPDLRAEFLAKMGTNDQVSQLFNHVPGVSYFLKDAQGRMMGASQSIIERFGLSCVDDLVGKVDRDFFPDHVADSFRRDDEMVMESGEPLIDRVEVWYTEQRLLDWFVTTKLPVRSVDGEIIGIMGVIRSYEGHRQNSLPYSQISGVVDEIRANHRGKVRVAALAKKSGLSTRQLHRKFLDVFGMSVQDFLMKTRIQAACDQLIRTDDPINEIATEFGFCDQSAFTQQFRKHMGTTPLKFRRQHCNSKQ